MMKTIPLLFAGLLLFSSCSLFPTQSELDGTRWLLQSLGGQPLLEDTVISAKFSQDGISGTSGCNFYGAKISFSPVKRLEIVEVANTEMYCEVPSGIMEQEELYLQTLAAANSYQLEDDNLFLMDRAGDILFHYRLIPRFENNPALLIGKTWRLISAEGMDVYQLDSFSLQFEEESFQGKTLCRDYEGSYQSVEDSLHISMLSMLGEVNCGQPELIAEMTYTSLLEMVDQYQVTPDRLELYTVKNDKLIFEWLPAE